VLLPLAALPAQAGSWSGPSYDATQLTWTDYYGTHTRTDLYYATEGAAGTSGTAVFTAHFTWVPSTGQTAQSDPPTPLYVKETVKSLWDASYSPSQPVPTGTADDGLGDQIILTNDPQRYRENGTSSGTHLSQQSGSGMVTLTRTLSVSISPGGRFNLIYTAAQDSRAVTISSSLGQTYSKGADGKPALNKPGSDGTLQDDTKVPGTFFNRLGVTYGANPIGGWSSGSQYNWNLALDSISNSGTFNPASIYPTGDNYSGGSIVKDGAREHAFIRLTDSNPEAASATANYWITFHNPVSGWVRNTMIYHPLPVGGPPDPNNIGEWKLYTTASNNNPSGTPPSIVSCALGTSVTDTVGGTIGGSQTSTLSADDVSQAFQTNESMTFSTAKSTSSTETYTAQNPAGYTTYVYYGVSSTDRAGTCDVWGTNGYQGISPWNGHAASLDSNGNATVAWTSFSKPPRSQ